MSTKNRDYYGDVFRELKKWGLLLESDPKLPGVCGIITGEPMKGSWWSHPMAQTIFQVNERLDDHPDVLIVSGILVRDTVEIMLQKVEGYEKSDLYSQRSGGFWDAYIRITNIEGLYAQLKERVTVLMTLRQQPW